MSIAKRVAPETNPEKMKLFWDDLKRNAKEISSMSVTSFNDWMVENHLDFYKTDIAPLKHLSPSAMDESMQMYINSAKSFLKSPQQTLKQEVKTGKTKNEVTVNASDYMFTDFSSSVISRVHKRQHDDDWFIKMRELDAKIHSSGMSEKINMTDDRLVMSAYKIMIKSEVFANPSLREWWIVKRYLEVYADNDTPMINELRSVINTYIGFAFSKAEISKDQAKEIKTTLTALSKVVYKDGYIELPQFVLDLIDEKRIIKHEPDEDETISVPTYDFTNEEDQWRGLRDVCEIILEGDLTDEEREEVEAALESANEILNG